MTNEKDNNNQLIDENLLVKFSNEKLKFFRLFLWYCYSDIYNWRRLAQDIYHLEHLIIHFDNYQLKEFFKNNIQNIIKYFTQFMKYLITIHIQSSADSSSFRNEINDYILNLRTHLFELKQRILSARECFNLCQNDVNALDKLFQSIENFELNSQRNFTEHDENKLHLISLKNLLNEKSNKNDFIQMKIYFDNQIKKLLEINKQNARNFETIKLIKMSNCHTRHIQNILSKTIKSSQTSRPYITFELDQIRKYQRQALIQSPYGTIPLYRRQAWAAANLFPGYSLNFLRYMQNSLRMQIHNLLGYDPSDLCNPTKKSKSIKITNKIINSNNQEITLVGTNNQFYRGQVDSCEIIPIKKNNEEKQLKIKKLQKEKTDIRFDELIQTNAKIFEENLFDYLDWQIEFNEQDLPDELCEELFDHWTSIVCDEPPSDCPSKSNSTITQINSIAIENQTDDNEIQCICSQCDEIDDENSLCICSQCSCQCLKQNDKTNENISEKSLKILSIKSEETIHLPSIPLVHISTDENVESCNCFQNHQSLEHFDSISNNIIHPIFHSIELDNPTNYRQQILNHTN